MKQIKIDPTETIEILPKDAVRKIENYIHASDLLDAPGREEVIENYCKILLAAVKDGQAKLIGLQRKTNQYRRMFEIWRPHVLRMKKTYGNDIQVDQAHCGCCPQDHPLHHPCPQNSQPQ